eukprot:TRINITY_DN7816_c0_g1_i1.p1 TRINITY_DN7816_c0_g1~~TRINITY_DN7816_c0_g1_i1.p1  ORF type:complete len:316 (+),score=66.06 TRINITY_DN7816_c0_g1_i1:38-949(+)
MEIIKNLHLSKFRDVRNSLEQLTASERIAALEVTDLSGDTMLHIAAQKANSTCVRYLLELGADVNARNHMGSTPLHKAALSESRSVVQILMETENIDLCAENDIGFLPIDYTRSNYEFYMMFHNAISERIGEVETTLSLPLMYIDNLFHKNLEQFRIDHGCLAKIQRNVRSKRAEVTLISISPKRNAECRESVLGKFKELKSQTVTEELTVDRNLHRKLIGAQGSRIKELRKITNTDIIIPKQNENSDIIKILGLPENIPFALQKINEFIANSPVIPRKNRKNRTPRNSPRNKRRNSGRRNNS